MPTFSEFVLERGGHRQNVLIVSFNYVEVGFAVLAFLVVLFYTTLAIGYHFWPAVFAPFVEPFQARRHGREQLQRAIPPGANAGRQRPE